MAIPLQSAQLQGNGVSLSVSFATTPTVGNIIVAVAVTDGTAILATSITDNQTNTYTQDAASAGVAVEVAIHSTIATTATGLFTVTLTPNATALQDLAIMEFAASAFATTGLVNQTFLGTEATTATPATASNATTAQCTIVGGISQSGGQTVITPGATYTELLKDEVVTNMPIEVEYKSVPAGTYSADWTLGVAVNCIGVAVAYKEAVASTFPPVPDCKLLSDRLNTLTRM